MSYTNLTNMRYDHPARRTLKIYGAWRLYENESLPQVCNGGGTTPRIIKILLRRAALH